MKTIIIVVRHAKHKDNHILQEEIGRVRQIGERWLQQGEKPTTVYSSPQSRAAETAVAFMGLATDEEVQKLSGLDAISSTNPEVIPRLKELKALPENANKTMERILCESFEFDQLLRARGLSFAKLLNQLATAHDGETIAVFSHGGTIEPGLSALLDPDFSPADVVTFLTEGQMTVVTIDSDGGIEVRYPNI